MVFRAVGKDTAGETDPFDLIEINGVRRNFHDHVFHAAIDHVGKGLVQKDGIGRSERGRDLAVSVKYAERADQRAVFPRLVQDRGEHMRGSRLSVGARNADHFHFRRRIAVKSAGEFAHRPAPVFHDDLADGQIAFALADDGDGASRHRFRRKIVTVAVASLKTYEHITVHDMFAVRGPGRRSRRFFRG